MPDWTICDRCSKEIDLAESWEGTGEWEGATLCSACASETEEDTDAQD